MPWAELSGQSLFLPEPHLPTTTSFNPVQVSSSPYLDKNIWSVQIHWGVKICTVFYWYVDLLVCVLPAILPGTFLSRLDGAIVYTSVTAGPLVDWAIAVISLARAAGSLQQKIVPVVPAVTAELHTAGRLLPAVHSLAPAAAVCLAVVEVKIFYLAATELVNGSTTVLSNKKSVTGCPTYPVPIAFWCFVIKRAMKDKISWS